MGDKFFTSNFNAKEVTDFLKKQYETLKDLSPLMKTARVFLKHTVDENFKTEGVHTGDKWTEWSEDWKKQRIKMGRGDGILALSGDLRRSISAKSGKDYAMVGTGLNSACQITDLKRRYRSVSGSVCRLPAAKFTLRTGLRIICRNT